MSAKHALTWAQGFSIPALFHFVARPLALAF